MPTTRPRRTGAFRRAVIALLVVAAVVVGVGIAFYRGLGPLPSPEGCSARVAGLTVDLSTEQAENASVIAAVGVRRDLPARAVSIALATAMQESKLRNLDHGDRDSLGIFQQRPSQGWGTRAQITDPYYAANRFYDELQKVHGYQSMRITEAAQRVQRSGYPEAYDEHAADARSLASALTGYSPAKFSCVVHSSSFDRLPAQHEGADGLTPRAERVRRDVEKAFGQQSLGGFAPGGVSSGHMSGSAHYDGRAVDIFFRPVSAAHKRHGWAVAAYLVAQAKRLDIDHVIFDGRIWSRGSKSEQGWRPYHPPESHGDRQVLMHRDHVHVDVLAGG
ncbi:MAG: hypothetical protein ACTHOK_20395 [Nocardioidaceae bacterium]